MSSGADAPVSDTRFLSRLQGFVGQLRLHGVPVGTGATVDLGAALRVLPLLERPSVRTACRVTLAKSPAEVRTVEEIFDAYWDGAAPPPISPPPDGRAAARSWERRTGMPSPLPRRRLPDREESSETMEGRYSRAAPASDHGISARPAEELRKLGHAARRFRRHVATLPGRRWEHAPEGGVDLRRTVRRGMRTGGEWVELVRRRRAPRRADLVVLWDVSGSMREHSSDLFALLHALARAIPRTRIYAFGHEIEEVSMLFHGLPYPRALPDLEVRLPRAGGGTQIAHCLAEFRRHWGGLVRPSTTVVIASDGWDLGEPEALAREVGRLRRAARRLVWVNPYAAERDFVPETAALKLVLPWLDLLTSPARFPLPYRGRSGTTVRPSPR